MHSVWCRITQYLALSCAAASITAPVAGHATDWIVTAGGGVSVAPPYEGSPVVEIAGGPNGFTGSATLRYWFPIRIGR
jgi:hypothetical protein